MNNFIVKIDEYYRQYYKRTVAFARSYVNDEMVAQDIASDAMVKLWVHLQDNPDAEVHHWLFVVVKNLCLDYLKHQRVKQKALSEVSMWRMRDLDFKISSLDKYGLDSVISKEIQVIVNEVLNTQNDKTRSIFIMSRLYGRKNREIAETLGLSEKNIEYHITKVLKALKLALKDHLILFVLLGLIEFLAK